jgi:4-carboxymuconolactone decarboxylase
MNPKPGLDFLTALDPDAADGIKQARRISPELIDALIERLYGNAYQRDKLTLRERFLVTIAALVSAGNMEGPMATQSRLALKSGVSREELMELVFQVSVFSGFGIALNAIVVIDAVADQLDIES